MSVSGYQSDVAQNSGSQTSRNSITTHEILAEHLSPSLTHLPSQNIYSLINENLMAVKDIRLSPNTPELEIADWLVSLPAPLVDQGVYTGTLFSVGGNPFFYSMDIDGRVTISGTFANEQDELILNINPYITELPLRFKTFGSPF
ncbi:hypothetical protein [uncultured Dokdonia sp.]|uniref:hypothetical protein n=1 Tax=uncultured Dokdonia sp. TaxID=575653 RepID=UPI0026122ECB|nr:hypothetical protein [uncultured Dokdonia sp.]